MNWKNICSRLIHFDVFLPTGIFRASRPLTMKIFGSMLSWLWITSIIYISYLEGTRYLQSVPKSVISRPFFTTFNDQMNQIDLSDNQFGIAFFVTGADGRYIDANNVPNYLNFTVDRIRTHSRNDLKSGENEVLINIMPCQNLPIEQQSVTFGWNRSNRIPEDRYFFSRFALCLNSTKKFSSDQHQQMGISDLRVRVSPCGSDVPTCRASNILLNDMGIKVVGHSTSTSDSSHQYPIYSRFVLLDEYQLNSKFEQSVTGVIKKKFMRDINYSWFEKSETVLNSHQYDFSQYSSQIDSGRDPYSTSCNSKKDTCDSLYTLRCTSDMYIHAYV